MMAAVAVSMLFAASLLPSMRIGLTALSGISVIVSVIACGAKYAAGTYISSAVLALVVIPSKPMPILYALFFGAYPLVKLYAEKGMKKTWSWLIKIIYANLSAMIIWVIVKMFFSEYLSSIIYTWYYAVIFVALNAVFIVYDLALTQAITFLIKRLKIDKRGDNF